MDQSRTRADVQAGQGKVISMAEFLLSRKTKTTNRNLQFHEAGCKSSPIRITFSQISTKHPENKFCDLCIIIYLPIHNK